MERRVLIALVLSFLVLYVYQTYVVKPVPRPAQTAAQQAQGAGIPNRELSMQFDSSPQAEATPVCRASPAALLDQSLVFPFLLAQVNLSQQEEAIGTERQSKLPPHASNARQDTGICDRWNNGCSLRLVHSLER